jgi:hypothetical protein
MKYRILLYPQHLSVQLLQATPSQDSAIPRIAHTIYWRKNKDDKNDFRFLSFLSVLSALYVAGLQHVYVHGDVEPTAQWWEALKNENVTFVATVPPSSIFHTPVNTLAHKSDVLR